MIFCSGKQISKMFWCFHTQSLKLTSKLTVVFTEKTNQNLGQAHQRPIAVAEKSQSHPVQTSGVHFWDKQLMSKNYQDFPATLILEAYLNKIWTLKLFYDWGHFPPKDKTKHLFVHWLQLSYVPTRTKTLKTKIQGFSVPRTCNETLKTSLLH